MADYTAKHTDDMEDAFGGSFVKVRAELGVTVFGVQVIQLPPDADGYPEHDHADDGQEEMYTALGGSGWLDIEGERVDLAPDTFVRVAPGTKRKIFAGTQGLRLLASAARPANRTRCRRSACSRAPSRRDIRGGLEVRGPVAAFFWGGMLYTVLYMAATRTQVYLTQSQRDRIEQLRAADGRSLAEVIRAALDEYLATHGSAAEEARRAEMQRVLDETFGIAPDFEVPPRDEWDRFDSNWNRIERS